MRAGRAKAVLGIALPQVCADPVEQWALEEAIMIRYHQQEHVEANEPGGDEYERRKQEAFARLKGDVQ